MLKQQSVCLRCFRTAGHSPGSLTVRWRETTMSCLFHVTVLHTESWWQASIISTFSYSFSWKWKLALDALVFNYCAVCHAWLVDFQWVKLRANCDLAWVNCYRWSSVMRQTALTFSVTIYCQSGLFSWEKCQRFKRKPTLLCEFMHFSNLWLNNSSPAKPDPPRRSPLSATFPFWLDAQQGARLLGCDCQHLESIYVE